MTWQFFTLPKRQGIIGLEENANLSAMQFTKKLKNGFSDQLLFPLTTSDFVEMVQNTKRKHLSAQSSVGKRQL